MTEHAATERDPSLLLAGLHLRLGSLALARAELETLAGADALDDLGRVDLVEARWRTGDLVGAGEVARAVLEGGAEPVVALIVAAEAAAGLGRPSEARRLAGRVLALDRGSIDTIFSGMPRSSVWPMDPFEPVPSPATLFPTERVIDAPTLAERAPDPSDEAPVPAPADDGPGLWDATGPTDIDAPDVGTPPPPTPAPSDPSHRLDTARAALAAGDPASAALHLGLLVRLAPALAPAIIETIGDHEDPALLMVRGDALRALGRDPEARAAYDRAMGGL